MCIKWCKADWFTSTMLRVSQNSGYHTIMCHFRFCWQYVYNMWFFQFAVQKSFQLLLLLVKRPHCSLNHTGFVLNTLNQHSKWTLIQHSKWTLIQHSKWTLIQHSKWISLYTDIQGSVHRGNSLFYLSLTINKQEWWEY